MISYNILGTVYADFDIATKEILVNCQTKKLATEITQTINFIFNGCDGLLETKGLDKGGDYTLGFILNTFPDVEHNLFYELGFKLKKEDVKLIINKLKEIPYYYGKNTFSIEETLSLF